MSREIKFKAWDKQQKQMIHPAFISNEPKQDSNYIYLQYTGLKDKNGIKIYEGDILEDSFKNEFGEEFKVERYKVEFINGCWCFIGERTNDCREVFEEIDLYNHFYFNEFDIEYFNEKGNLKDFQVIGNIYKNPELLKEDKQ